MWNFLAHVMHLKASWSLTWSSLTADIAEFLKLKITRHLQYFHYYMPLWGVNTLEKTEYWLLFSKYPDVYVTFE